MDGEVRIKAYAMDVECRRLSFGGMEADLLENSGLNGCGNKDERVWFKRRRFAYEGFDGLPLLVLAMMFREGRSTSVMKWPCTSGLSSFSKLQVCWARKPLRCSSSRKKFTPRSDSVTTAESWIVNCPIPEQRQLDSMLFARERSLPGSTRFFSVSTPTTPGPELMRRMCASSKACWPLAAHRRSCLSYFFSFDVGPWSGGGVVPGMVGDDWHTK